MTPDIFDEPSDVTASHGTVKVIGPDGVDVHMTPDAAAETSDRLLQAATKAQGQSNEANRQAEERRSLGLE